MSGDALPEKGFKREMLINEDTFCKIIGVTLETRPDCLCDDEILFLRECGCTRVQIGIQSIYNEILDKINRQHTIEDAIEGIYRLKNNGFKVIIHIMPNLPGATLEMDRKMFEYILKEETIQADEWKIYPCQTVTDTIIKKWYDEGTYKPYDTKLLMEMLMKVMNDVHPWIRLSRVIRDIPQQYILEGPELHMRDIIKREMDKRGMSCNDIRSRAVGRVELNNTKNQNKKK